MGGVGDFPGALVAAEEYGSGKPSRYVGVRILGLPSSPDIARLIGMQGSRDFSNNNLEALAGHVTNSVDLTRGMADGAFSVVNFSGDTVYVSRKHSAHIRPLDSEEMKTLRALIFSAAAKVRGTP
ncbi:MAG: hypothetical protein HYT16_03370 [DPANN group archaeon]|nr:hypothetical protein [DPANN group archaeon]